MAAKVKQLTGDDWALPYWNYLDTSNPDAHRIPDAFLAETLPDGGANPLVKYPRRLGFKSLPAASTPSFNLSAMDENDFLVGGDGTIGFGGGISGDFVLHGRWTGDLELNPHNSVHNFIGGNNGFMADPRLAGLDPIFWLHHCNIDRLWEAWMRTPGKTMVHDARWSEGPANRHFIMPVVGSGNQGMAFSGADALRGGKVYRNYDDLTKGTNVSPGVQAMTRVSMGAPQAQSVEPIGANATVLKVGAAPVETLITLEPAVAAASVANMRVTEPGQDVSRLYLALESVRGTAPAPMLEVYLNLPNGADPRMHPELQAGSLALFGLNVASMQEGAHGGNGLSYTLDITDLAQRLKDANDFDPGNLRVTLVPVEQITDAAVITVERVSVLKRSGIVR